jgi:Zn-dependent peptidase ImmA (M78 family)
MKVEGVDVHKVSETNLVEPVLSKKLRTDACDEWWAMSVPPDFNERWAVFINDCHTKERRRVTILEEYWHILLGHKAH